MKMLKSIAIGAFFLMGWGNADATVLGDAAAQLKPGEWTEIQTSGMSSTLLRTSGYNGSNFNILQYAAKAAWDPGTKQFLFIGSPHYNPYKFIIYSDETNSWRTGPLPVSAMSTGAGCSSHTYYYATMDPASGQFYYYLPCKKTIGALDVKTEKWTQLPSSLSTYYPNYGGLAYFPERNGLIYVSGWPGCWWFDLGANKWAANVPVYKSDTYHCAAVYNPVHKVVLFGGGNSDQTLYAMDAQGQVQLQTTAPAPVGTNNGLLTLDPVSGQYLLYTGSTFHEYNVPANNWSSLPSPPAALNDWAPGKGMAATPVSTYGVVMFLTHTGKVFIYKHAEKGPSSVERPLLQPDLSPSIAAFPNPFRKSLNLTVQGSNLEIRGLNGTLVQKWRLKGKVNRLTWSGKGLPKGIYIVRAVRGPLTTSRTIVLE